MPSRPVASRGTAAPTAETAAVTSLIRLPSPRPPGPPPARSAPPPGAATDAALHLGAATLGLGHLHERRGEALIRIPVHRRQQDPGCEWHVRRVAGRLLGLDLTCETMEDWIGLAAASPDLVVTLYRDLFRRDDIPAADLFWARDVFVKGPDGPTLAFAAGSYNPLNAWNTVRGAVHLTGPVGDSPLRGGLRLPESGLLRLGAADVTAAVLRPHRRDDRTGRVLRLEVAPPPGAAYVLEDLTLPGREPFTPLGLVRCLARGAQRATWTDRGPGGGGADWPESEDDGEPGAYAIPAPRTMPGVLVAAAMLRASPMARA